MLKAFGFGFQFSVVGNQSVRIKWRKAASWKLKTRFGGQAELIVYLHEQNQ
jgi:hypothetical protein